MNNRNIFAANLKRQMKLSGKSRRDVCEALGFSYYTFSDWVNAKKYPRMDKVEMLANYFGILKSDLIEEKTEEHAKVQEKNDIIADAVVKMREDKELLDIIEFLCNCEPEKLKKVSQIIQLL